MSGAGVGGALGGAGALGLGTLLAPETMGASLAIPTAVGAAGSALGSGVGSAATGGNNPWGAALTGGLGGAASGLAGGLLSGLLSGGGDAAASAGEVDYGAVSDAASDAGTTGTGATGDTGAISPSSGENISGSSSGNISGVGASALPSNASSSQSWLQQAQNYLGLGGGNSPSTSAQQISGAASKGNSLSDYLLPAGVGLGIASALFPTGSNPVNTSAVNNAASNMNMPLPSYNYNSVSTPYTGNWYTYGQRPETPMISNTVTPAARGGLMRGYAQGGRVRALAMGGLPMQSPMGQPPMANPQQSPPQLPPQAPPQAIPQQAMMPRPAGMPAQGATPQQKPNPAQQAAQFQIGQKIGMALRKHIKNSGMTPDGLVSGHGKGQDDVVPAKLSKDEYVLPAEVVSQLGDGSSTAGGKELDKMVANIRAQKTSKGSGFPPKAKSPLAYLGDA